MRILVHTIFYRPELTGVAKYTAEMCEWLAERGHEVEVVCPPPYYPHWKVPEGYRQWTYSHESLDGVRVTRCPIWLPSRPGGLRRILYSLSFCLSSFPIVLSKLARRPDVVFVLEPSFLNTIPSLLVGYLARALTWLQIKDFEVDIAFELGQLRGSWLRSILLRAESHIMKRFAVVSTISLSMRAKALAKGISEDRCVLFPDWVDTDRIIPLKAPTSLRSELAIPENWVVALFSGTLNAKLGIETLIAAARELRRDPSASNILIVICGDGAAAGKLRALGSGLPNLRFLPLQPAESLNELLNAADIHVLPQLPDVADSVLPSKLLGMLASGRPIVATVSPETEVGRIVRDCGLLTNPGDGAGLAAAIQILAADPHQRARLGAKAREAAECRFRLDTILSAFEKELEARVTRRPIAGKLVEANR